MPPTVVHNNIQSRSATPRLSTSNLPRRGYVLYTVRIFTISNRILELGAPLSRRSAARNGQCESLNRIVLVYPHVLLYRLLLCFGGGGASSVWSRSQETRTRRTRKTACEQKTPQPIKTSTGRCRKFCPSAAKR